MRPGLASLRPISFLFTYHNEAGLLTEALESLRPELRPGDEVIVYDDASAERPAAHVPSGLPVKIHRGEHNLGPGKGRNHLAAVSAHAWIHFHDADDLFAPGWRDAVSRFLETPAELVLTEVRTFGLTSQDAILGVKHLSSHDSLVRWAIQGAMLPAAGTYRKELFERAGGFRSELWQSEDMDFGIRAALVASAFGVVEESLGLLRNRSESRSKEEREVLRSGVAALDLLAADLPAAFQGDLAERAATLGMLLLQAGDDAGAGAAWEVVAKAGGAPLAWRSLPMRLGARFLGLPLAERLSLWARRLRRR